MANGAAAALQKALENKGKGKPAPAEAAGAIDRTGGYRAPSREGKTPITAYLSPDFKRSLRLIQAKREVSVQELIAEALNDLFDKHNVPTVDYP